MAPTPDSALVLFPGALGDCLCFLPTLAALRRKHTGHIRLVAQPAVLDLLRLHDMTAVSIHGRELADLFSPGSGLATETAALFAGFDHIYSWTGYGDAGFARRLAQASGGTVHVHRFCGMNRGEHAADYYARCVALPPAPLEASLIADDPIWFAGFAARYRLTARQFILLHPGSGARAKNWEGFGGAAQVWRQRHPDSVVLLRGPAEMERPTASIEDATVVDGVSLTQVSALLRRCRLYLGNDSGVSHLAGVVGTRSVIVFGPTDPAVWAPRGPRVQIFHARNSCVHCGPERFCTHRLAVEPVIMGLESAISVEL
jgi:heptosyltransferase III